MRDNLKRYDNKKELIMRALRSPQYWNCGDTMDKVKKLVIDLHSCRLPLSRPQCSLD